MSSAAANLLIVTMLLVRVVSVAPAAVSSRMLQSQGQEESDEVRLPHEMEILTTDITDVEAEPTPSPQLTDWTGSVDTQPAQGDLVTGLADMVDSMVDRIRREVASIRRVQGQRFRLLMRLLQVSGLQDCAGRVVCDLSCDATRYGPAGERLLALMTRFTEANVMDADDIKVLGAASVSGRMYYWTAGCDRCRDVYPTCFAESGDLVEAAALFDLDSL